MKDINAFDATTKRFEEVDFVTTENGSNDRDFNVVPLHGKVSAQDSTVSYDWEQSAEENKPSGLVYDFCQVYNVEEAITQFCNDTVTCSPNNDKATFYHNNKVEYPGTFAISPDKELCAYNNGSNCQYMNAFDTVIFLVYKHLDTEDDNQPVKNRTKSFLTFRTLLNEDKKMQDYLKEKSLIDRGLNPETDAWMLDLTYNTRGRIEDALANYHLIIENDKTFENICFSEFHQAIVKTKPFEWNEPDELENSRYGAILSQIDYDNIKMLLANEYGFQNPKSDPLATALKVKAYKKRISPTKDWFNEIRDTWDYTPRMENLLQNYLGVPDNAYYRFLSASIVIGAVARALATGDGVQFDITPVLYGKQGLGKTSFCRDLMIPGHYTSLNSISGKSVELKLGTGICELSEGEVLDGHTSIAGVKSFLTETCVKHRYVYERNATPLLRKCIFIVTTNEKDGLLRDETGNRRFWPVMCQKDYIPGSITEHERNQIFAEALMYYDLEIHSGFMHTNDPEILEYADSLRKEFESNRELKLAIADYIEDTMATELCAKELYVNVLHKNINNYKTDNKMQKILFGILRNLDGWQEDSTRIDYKKFEKNSIFRKVS